MEDVFRTVRLQLYIARALSLRRRISSHCHCQTVPMSMSVLDAGSSLGCSVSSLWAGEMLVGTPFHPRLYVNSTPLVTGVVIPSIRKEFNLGFTLASVLFLTGSAGQVLHIATEFVSYPCLDIPARPSLSSPSMSAFHGSHSMPETGYLSCGTLSTVVPN